jgi:hypothetical protein
MEAAYLACDQKRYAHAISYAPQAADAPIPATQLWREPNEYTDQPPRTVLWCPEHPGELDQALVWAERARVRVPDPEWESRTVRLQSAARRSVGGQARTVRALNRLGAVGDVLVNQELANRGLAARALRLSGDPGLTDRPRRRALGRRCAAGLHRRAARGCDRLGREHHPESPHRLVREPPAALPVVRVSISGFTSRQLAASCALGEWRKRAARASPRIDGGDEMLLS